MSIIKQSALVLAFAGLAAMSMPSEARISANDRAANSAELNTQQLNDRQSNARKPNARKPNARKPNARKPNARVPNARFPNARRPNGAEANVGYFTVVGEGAFDDLTSITLADGVRLSR